MTIGLTLSQICAAANVNALLIAIWQRRCQNWERPHTHTLQVPLAFSVALQEISYGVTAALLPPSLSYTGTQSDRGVRMQAIRPNSKRISSGGADGVRAALVLAGSGERPAGRASYRSRSRLQSPCSFDTWHATRTPSRNRVRDTLRCVCDSSEISRFICRSRGRDTERRLNFHFMVMMRLFRRRCRE